jgi:hypothetical protein
LQQKIGGRRAQNALTEFAYYTQKLLMQKLGTEKSGGDGGRRPPERESEIFQGAFILHAALGPYLLWCAAPGPLFNPSLPLRETH